MGEMSCALKWLRRRVAAVLVKPVRENVAWRKLTLNLPHFNCRSADENCRGELKHPALFAFTARHTI